MRRFSAVTPLAALALAVAGSIAHGQSSLPAAVRKAADSITADNLARDLAYFASDELAGRDTGSPGFDKAAAYIVERLKKAGLKPLGDNGTFLQHYELRQTDVQTGEAVIEIGGAKFAFGDGFLMRSIAAPISGTYQAVYVGHGWTVPDRQIDPYAGVDVKGKLVVAHGPRALPAGVEIQQLGRISLGATPVVQEAYRRGAVGVVFIPQASALSGWAGAREQNLTVREV
jgi:hypothetical protein